MDPREEKIFKDHFNRLVNDNEARSSLWGYPESEFDHGSDLNEDDEDAKEAISRVHTDEELESAVKELLRNSHRLDARDITVGVHKGEVQLRGTVKSQEERDYALSIVKLIHGIGNVKSDLIVKIHGGILPTDLGRKF